MSKVGYVYQIVQRGDHEKPIRYIGSTFYPKTRWSMHKSMAKKMENGIPVKEQISIYKYFKSMGFQSFKWDLLEEKMVESTLELRMLEQKYIEQLDCINAHAAYSENSQKAYYMRSRDKLVTAMRKKAVERRVCECGIEHSYSGRSSHLKSMRHINLMKEKISAIIKPADDSQILDTN